MLVIVPFVVIPLHPSIQNSPRSALGCLGGATTRALLPLIKSTPTDHANRKASPCSISYWFV